MSSGAKIELINSELKLRLTADEIAYVRNDMVDKYVPPSSNRQIATLLRIGKPAVYYRLSQLICKFRGGWDFAAANFFLLKNKNMSDLDYLNKIFTDVRPKIGASSSASSSAGSKDYIASWMANHIEKYIQAPQSIMDLGCGNCILTRSLGAALKTPVIWGADIAQEFERKWVEQRPKDITFKTIKNNNLDFGRKFDIVSCFMVLHHIPLDSLDKYIKDIYDLVSPGGLFIIKEHDCFNAVDYLICDLEHTFFIARESVAESKKIDSQAIINIREQKINYKNRFVWRYLFERAGFKMVFETPYDLSPTQVYPPNRAYFSIFKKK
jgi:2-polyprenyl-3-methyl-5-hydroxy-6-metoxy-1,4-benzoquinol methylase